MKGENVMKAFNNSEFEKHQAEAKEKWGETPALVLDINTRCYSSKQFTQTASSLQVL